MAATKAGCIVVLHNGNMGEQRKPGNKTFPKMQTLHYMVGYQAEAGMEPLLCADEPSPSGAAIKTPGTWVPPTAKMGSASLYESKLPQWIENDRKVLRFEGYYQEHVTEQPNENYRVRKVVFLYYLEDSSFQISEPRQDNSGLPQGQILRRHKAVKEDGSQVTPLDMEVGSQIAIYGRRYQIMDCDQFTRDWYYTLMSIEHAPAIAYPADPLATFKASRSRKKASLGPPSCRTDDMTRFNEARLGKPTNVLDADSLRQFLANDGKVLRFWAVWDERDNMYGDRRPYVVHYYLADDTVEVLEVHEMNCGRDPFPVFVRRGPMPKGRYTSLSTTSRLSKLQCYAPEDLRVGASINIHSRNLVLYACDDFTRRWYKENMGFCDEELADMDIREEIPALPKPAMAPYNGYGTLKDSEQNCKSLIPKPPKKDLRKLVNKDGMILRFVCKYQASTATNFSVAHADKDRQFILSYFMNDDTMSVFEPPIRNSGVIGGKFLERGIKYKRNTEEQYTYKDLYVGAEIQINSFNFLLANADEYTFSYMENNKHLFIMGDGTAVLRLLKAQVEGREDALRSAFIEIDRDGSGHLDAEELAECLLLAGFRITKHQVIALARMLDTDKSGAVDTTEFLKALDL